VKNRPAPAIAGGLRPAAGAELEQFRDQAGKGDRSMTWLFICLALAVATFFYVFYHLPGNFFLGPEKTRAGYLRERKDAVYENLRDLNFEYKAGKFPTQTTHR